MLRKLLIMAIVPVAMIFAVDVSVTNAYTNPSPAVVDVPNSIIAKLSITNPSPPMVVPIHGAVETVESSDTILNQDFEGETFPPEGWNVVTTNEDTTWFRGNVETIRHHDSWGAYVYPSQNSSNEWIITPSIDLTSVAEGNSVTLIFNSSFSPAPEDAGFHNYVCVSEDGGHTWIDTLIDLAHYFEKTTGDPVYINDFPNPVEIDLSDYAGDSIAIGFNYSASNEGFSAPQTIDDVMIVVQNYTILWSADEDVSIPAPLTNYYYQFLSKWTPDEEGVYRLRVWTSYMGDEDPTNDMFVGSAVAGGETDLAAVQIVRPNGIETPNEAFVPQCVVVNLSDKPASGVVKCFIDSAGTHVYEDSVMAIIDTGATTNIRFNKAFNVGDVGTIYDSKFAIINPSDVDTSNNHLSKAFKAGYTHSIVPITAIAPADGEHYSAPFNPKAAFENQGTLMENDWWAKVVIVEPTSGYAWSDSVHVFKEIWPMNQEVIVFYTFNPCPGGDLDYICTFSAASSTEGFESQNLQVGFSAGPGSGVNDDILPKEYALGILNGLSTHNPTINYALPKTGHLALKAYDVSGKLVKTLVDKATPAGYGSITLDTQNMPAGLYFVRMIADDFTATRKLVLVR